MIEQFNKAIQQFNANPFVAFANDAAQKVQQNIKKATADAAEFAQMEMGNLTVLAQAKKPEDVVAATVKSVQARQAFITQKSKDLFDQMVAASAELTKTAESKGEHFSDQASGAIDAAFATAKQGLGMAETAIKSAVTKNSGKRK